MTLVWEYGRFWKNQVLVTSFILLNTIFPTFFLVNNEIHELKESFAPDLIPNLIPSSALELPATSSTTKYLEDNLQRIFKIVLEAWTSIILIVFLEKPYKKLLKANFLNMYCTKTYIEYYNFCQQCKNYFTMVEA